ncbi:CNNM domain-containing protein [Chloroflexota bacterium]
MDTPSVIFIVIVLCLLLSFSAFFSGSETALMALSRLRLRIIAKSRPRRAKIVESILQKPEGLIGTILLGNNLVNVAMSAMATALAISFWGQKGIAYVTGILTLAILIFAEITPKVYAKYHNERVSLVVAPVLKIIMVTFNPVVVVITFLANKLLLLGGVDVSKIKKPLLTEAEIKTYIQVASDDGAITSEEKKMLSRVFTLNDKTVEDIMVPKKRMTVLNADVAPKQIVRVVLNSGYSRLPVSKGKGMNIIGFVHAKDLLRLVNTKKPVSLRNIMRPAYFIEHDRKIDAQLRSFKAKKLHQAVVLDKEDKVIGLITLEDILEELVGNIQDEHDLA